MKKFMTLVFALSVIVLWSGSGAFAQGKGGGHNPGASAGQPRTPAVQGKHEEHAEHADKKDHHEAKEAKKEEKFEERIERNPQLRARVESLLPAGMTLKTAAMGFRNQGQFIAALHVSKNLNIPFADLKSKMTGDHAVPLGKAIQELRPTLSEKQAKAEAEKAENQAKETEKTKSKPIS